MPGFVEVFARLYRNRRWQPVEFVPMWGELVPFPAVCRCHYRMLNGPHYEPGCPYIAPDDWYAAEVERMREMEPA